MSEAKIGVMLVNLGTPDDTRIRSIRRYLRVFLMDRRVIDLPAVLRALLVYGAILPFRPYRTAKAYRKIWQPEGSPLLLHTQALADAVQHALGPSYQVEVGMRYGSPSVAGAADKLASCNQWVVLPLFPQYASAATGSAIEAVMRAVGTLWNTPSLFVKHAFYDDPNFIEAYAALIKPHMMKPSSFLLLSYHGLPERHLDKSACRTACDRHHACPAVGEGNLFCYRAQCYRTSSLLQTTLALPDERIMTAFQSRLGRIPWIKPYTDKTLHKLRAQGVEHLVVACPSFTADCLETLEEIGMEARDEWKALGGASFTLVPCLNACDAWVQAVSGWVKQTVKQELL